MSLSDYLGAPGRGPQPQRLPESVPLSSQRVVIMCGGVHCAERARTQMLAVRGSVPERIFRDGSEFLGSPSVRWTGLAWEWNVVDATAEDVTPVRKLLSIMCPPQPDARRRLETADARTQELSRAWKLAI